jgi:hypothetical protein
MTGIARVIGPLLIGLAVSLAHADDAPETKEFKPPPGF